MHIEYFHPWDWQKWFNITAITTFIQHCAEDADQWYEYEKEIKTIKGEVELSSVADDIIKYIEHPKMSQKKTTTRIISKVSKVSW